MATSNPTMPRPNMPELGYGSWPNATAPQVGYGSRPTATAPQVGYGSRPTATAIQAGYGSWPNATAPQVGFGTWPNVKAPAPTFDPGPIAVAPMPQPVIKPTRRGRTIVAWSLSMLAIGLAAGPLLARYVDKGLEAGIDELAKLAPSFLRPYLPKPLQGSTPQPLASSRAQEISVAPSMVATARTAPEPPEPSTEIAKSQVAAQAPEPAAMAKTVAPERRTERAKTRKTRATRRHAMTLAAAESAAPVPTAKPARRSRGGQRDPFETSASPVVAPERPTKTAVEPVAAKSRPASSGDSLDDLMAGATSASPSKDHRNSSKTIDALLQDVQKSQPAPRPARAQPEALPSLTASDIAKAMAGVKTGAKVCGTRFGESGVADLRLTVGKNGRVSDVAVRGKLAGSPVSDCITQVVQRASFPPNSGLKFNYRIDVR